MTIWGWDCSDFDWTRGSVDVVAAYADGIRLFTHKATEGTKVQHKRFGTAMACARAAGMPYLGAYIVPRTPGSGGHGSVAAQVRYFVDYVSAQAPWWREHPGWFWQIDLEHWSNVTGVYDAVKPAVAVEVSQRLAATGRPRVLYAPKWAYGDSIGGTDPLWQSAYGDNPAVHYRKAYPGDGSSRWGAYSGRSPLVLQYGSKTNIGTQTTCDANAIRDESAWRALFGEDSMATISQQDWDALIWRQEALASGRDTVVGGPTKGQPVPLVGEVRALAVAVAAVRSEMPPPVDEDALVDRVVEQLATRLPTAEDIALALMRQLLPTTPAGS